MERDELILRINGVEKSQRLCKAMVLVLIIVLSLILLQGAGPKHTQLKAHSLNIINEEGDVVATIGTDKEGGGVLALMEGKQPANKVSLSSRGLVLLSRGEMQSALLRNESTAYFVIKNKQGTSVAEILESQGPNPRGSIILRNGAGNEVHTYPAIKH